MDGHVQCLVKNLKNNSVFLSLFSFLFIYDIFLFLPVCATADVDSNLIELILTAIKF